MSEDPPRAGWLTAEELADMEVAPDRLATPWQVSDRPLVVAVDRLGPRSASGTRPSASGGLKRGDALVRADRHALKLETVIGRKQAGGEGASAWHRYKSYRPPSPSSPKSSESRYLAQIAGAGVPSVGCGTRRLAAPNRRPGMTLHRHKLTLTSIGPAIGASIPGTATHLTSAAASHPWPSRRGARGRAPRPRATDG